jgi:O-antigen/teichoic acid export membrane protein
VKKLLARAASSDIGRQGTLLFFALLVLNASNYVFYALAARALPIADYGILMALLSLMIVMTAPALVAQNSLSKLVADVAATGNLATVGGLARSTQRFAGIVAGAVFVIAVLLRGPIGALVHATDPLLVPLMAAVAAGAIVVPLQRGVFQGASRFGELALSMLVESAVRVATVVPLARIAGIRGALVALTLAFFAPAITSAVRARAVWPHAQLGGLDLRRAFVAVLQTGSGFLAVITMLYFDVILVRHYFDSYDAGLYSGVSLVGRAIFAGVAFVPMVVIPKVVSRRASGESIRPVVFLAAGVMAAAAFCAIGIVAFAPERVLSILGGPAFRPAAPYLLPYAFAATILATVNVAVAIRVGLHRFAHVIPLVVILLGEVIMVTLRHQQISDVLWVIVVGHTAALVATVAVTAFERVPARRDQESSLSTRTLLP